LPVEYSIEPATSLSVASRNKLSQKPKTEYSLPSNLVPEKNLIPLKMLNYGKRIFTLMSFNVLLYRHLTSHMSAEFGEKNTNRIF
jgi:hypothetical protein